MIVDTSALVAILREEDDAPALRRALATAPSVAIAAATLLECAVVILRRFGPERMDDFDRMIAGLEIEVVAFDREQLGLARRGYARFGKGTGAGALNFGDCFAYALAKSTGEPLLFKGEDFARTDVIPALS